jgi:cell division protein ZapA (FtsZ GTPase activity inhibitor)
MIQKNLSVSIFGKKYLISTDEGSDIVAQAADVVENLMKSKAEHIPLLQNDSRLAIIVALELAAEVAKKTQKLKQCEDKILALNKTLSTVS